MDNKQELQNEIQALMEHAEVLQGKINNIDIEKRTGRIIDTSAIGDCAEFFVISDNSVHKCLWCECDYVPDEIKVGSAFYDKESAEKENLRLRTIQKLRVAAGGFKPNWNDDENKYAIHYSSGIGLYTDFHIDNRRSFLDVYFGTATRARKALASLTEKERNSLLEG